MIQVALGNDSSVREVCSRKRTKISKLVTSSLCNAILSVLAVLFQFDAARATGPAKCIGSKTSPDHIPITVASVHPPPRSEGPRSESVITILNETIDSIVFSIERFFLFFPFK